MISLTTDDLKKLSVMARVPLPESEEEKQKILEKFQSVLDFVAQVEAVEVPDSVPHYYGQVNVARNDFLFNTDPEFITEEKFEIMKQERDQTREDILNEFPSRRGDHLVVPLVLKKSLRQAQRPVVEPVETTNE